MLVFAAASRCHCRATALKRRVSAVLPPRALPLCDGFSAKQRAEPMFTCDAMMPMLPLRYFSADADVFFSFRRRFRHIFAFFEPLLFAVPPLDRGSSSRRAVAADFQHGFMLRCWPRRSAAFSSSLHVKFFCFSAFHDFEVFPVISPPFLRVLPPLFSFRHFCCRLYRVSPLAVAIFALAASERLRFAAPVSFS